MLLFTVVKFDHTFVWYIDDITNYSCYILFQHGWRTCINLLLLFFILNCSKSYLSSQYTICQQKNLISAPVVDTWYQINSNYINT